MSTLRLMAEGDIPQIMAIIAQAQAYLKAQGIDQWQNGYPDEAVVREDIALERGYVLEDAGRVVGMAALVFDGEPTYQTIYEGTWQTPEPYAAVHRIAVDASCRGQGISDVLMQGVEAVIRKKGFPSARIDTHRDNVVMQRMLQRNGYTLCGVIYLSAGAERGAQRVALEKRL